MPAIVRKGDKDTDDDAMVTGSPNVFVNGIAATRHGDKDTDDDQTITKKPWNVFINGIPVSKV
jgi:uncharacterized Zn-binding protein involved in type VI secretion